VREEVVLDLADDIGDQASIIIVRQGSCRVTESRRINKDRQKETEEENN